MAISRVIADHRGTYVTHVRGETAPLITSAIGEVLSINERTGVPIHISHLKVIGLRPEDWGRIDTILNRLTAAKKDGIDVGFDCYPYTRGSTMLSALLPRWAHDDGIPGLMEKLQNTSHRHRIRTAIEADDFGGENWLKTCGFEAVKIGSVSNPEHEAYVGRNLLEVAHFEESGSIFNTIRSFGGVQGRHYHGVLHAEARRYAFSR